MGYQPAILVNFLAGNFAIATNFPQAFGHAIVIMLLKTLSLPATSQSPARALLPSGKW